MAKKETIFINTPCQWCHAPMYLSVGVDTKNMYIICSKRETDSCLAVRLDSVVTQSKRIIDITVKLFKKTPGNFTKDLLTLKLPISTKEDGVTIE